MTSVARRVGEGVPAAETEDRCHERLLKEHGEIRRAQMRLSIKADISASSINGGPNCEARCGSMPSLGRLT